LKDETAEMTSPQTLIGLEPGEVNPGKSIAPVLKKRKYAVTFLYFFPLTLTLSFHLCDWFQLNLLSVSC